ncbi:MAG: hypothetical protein WBG41_14315, partial [Acidimicrobiales bacterium]
AVGRLRRHLIQLLCRHRFLHEVLENLGDRLLGVSQRPDQYVDGWDGRLQNAPAAAPLRPQVLHPPHFGG